MSTNAALARRFEQMARLLELLGEDKFRVNAHARAARTMESLTRDVGTLAKDRPALLALEGVGPKVADKIIEFVATGKIQEHVDLLARVPPGLLGVLEISGVGPKTARALWDTLGVTSVDDLKRVIADRSILGVPRMGEKAVEKIKAAIVVAEEGAARLPLGLALPVAERVVERMRRVTGVTRAAFAGSLRRGRETVGDIDVLVCAADPEPAHRAFCAMPGVRQVIVSGASKSSVRLSVEAVGAGEGPTLLPPDGGGGEAGGSPLPEAAGGRSVQVDLRVVPEESWGAALMYFTGSKEHNIRLRERSLKRGLSLNEYGLYPSDDDAEPPHKRGVRAVAGQTEEQVYEALGLSFVPPEAREDHGEIDAAERGPLPRLLEVADIRAELHAHTTASDGNLSIEELATEAMRRGMHTIAVTDHSRSSVIAGGLSVERLREHVAAVRRVAGALRPGGAGGGITVLTGSEVDILADGTLDYDEEALGLLDVVVASPHAALSQDSATATRRLLRAIEHPRVSILGHPTGRLIGRRGGLEPAMDELFAAAKRHDVALEINAHWMRLDLRDTHVRGAVESGCLIAIDCDVHAAEDFDNLRFGVMAGRRGWLTAERCINCWPADRLHEWLRSKR